MYVCFIHFRILLLYDFNADNDETKPDTIQNCEIILRMIVIVINNIETSIISNEIMQIVLIIRFLCLHSGKY